MARTERPACGAKRGRTGPSSYGGAWNGNARRRAAHGLSSLQGQPALSKGARASGPLPGPSSWKDAGNGWAAALGPGVWGFGAAVGRAKKSPPDYVGGSGGRFNSPRGHAKRRPPSERFGFGLWKHDKRSTWIHAGGMERALYYKCTSHATGGTPDQTFLGINL